VIPRPQVHCTSEVHCTWSGNTIRSYLDGILWQVNQPVAVDPVAEQAAPAASFFERLDLVTFGAEGDFIFLDDHLPGGCVSTGALIRGRPGERLKNDICSRHDGKLSDGLI